MKFLVDENISEKVCKFLISLGYSVIYIPEVKVGLDDPEVLKLAVLQDYIVISSDKDFGELVFKHLLPHRGIILLRLKDQTSSNMIKAIRILLKQSDNLEDNFIVITEQDSEFKIRVRAKFKER